MPKNKVDDVIEKSEDLESENSDVEKKGKSKKGKKNTKKNKDELAALKEEIESLKTKNEDLESQLEVAQTQETTAKEEALRNLAELENFKRRKQQEVDTFKKYAAESVIVEFLPVLDNFLIACEHANNDDQDKSEVVKGFVMIQQLLTTVLEKLNVTAIEAVDQPFDPNLHQAISQEEKEDVEADMVIKEMQKGYKLHDRVIRPSMVVVSQ